MLFRSAIAAASLLVTTVCAKVVTYNLPPNNPSYNYTASDFFSLTVNGTAIHTVEYSRYDYAQVSISEGYETEFKVTIWEDITSYTISPQQLPMKHHMNGTTLTFSVSQAHYLVVNINAEKQFVILIDPLETDQPASSGSGIFNVLDYGADHTGHGITKGIQTAMDAAGKKPGSIVYVPAGFYLVGNLKIPSQTSLYVAGGAVLRFTGNPDDYNTTYATPDIGKGTWWIQTEFNSKDIKVFGRGTIDGNGYNTRLNRYVAVVLAPAGTTNFKCDGILIRDSPYWTVMPTQVTKATFTNMKILNRFDVTQNDGIDVVESTNVLVDRVIAIANDDAFSTKTWAYMDGTTVPYPYKPRGLSDVTFTDCLAWTLCFGFKVGQGVWERQENVVFKDSVAYAAGVGLGMDHKWGSDTAANISFYNIDIERMHGEPGGMASWMVIRVQEVGSGSGNIEGVKIRDIRVRAKGAKSGYLEGHNSTSMVSGVTFTDIYMGADATTPATSLKDMNILLTDYSKGTKISNT